MMTPHEGELKRMHVNRQNEDNTTKSFKTWCKEHNLVRLLKGPISRSINEDSVFYNMVNRRLARGRESVIFWENLQEDCLHRYPSILLIEWFLIFCGKVLLKITGLENRDKLQ